MERRSLSMSARSKWITRLVLAFGPVVLGGGGCREPAGLKQATSESSGSAGDATTSSSSSSSSNGMVPDPMPPEPFVLPEGCGDGIVVSGQYDCHYPVSLDYLKEAMGARDDPFRFMGWDMDGNGRDELLAQALGFTTSRILAPLRWNGERFDVGRPVEAQVSLPDWTTHFDVDGDGQSDLVKLDNTSMAYHTVTSSFELDDEVIPALFDVPTLGQVGPIDIDADGELEALVVRWPFSDDEPFAPQDLWLHRNVGGTWAPVGEALDLPGCPWPSRFAWSDFDGDGHEDVAMLNHPSACDPFPLEYDPTWHSISIFYNDPMTQTLAVGPVIAAGGITYGDLLMLEDFDGDGDLDFLVGLGVSTSQRMTGAALMRGHGDGSFDEGVPIELPGITEWELQGRGDLDGDGDLDWILKGNAVVDDIFAAEPEIVRVHSDVVGKNGEPWYAANAFGDFNGDGVVDYVAGWRIDQDDFRRVAMISSP